MTKKLQDKLYKKYPKLFVDRHKSIQESCMAWGCEIDDGWYPLLNILCQSITNYIKRKNDEFQYWEDKKDKKNKIKKPDWIKKVKPVKFAQIKEKWGKLRIYISGGDDNIQTMIDFAETISGYICESCGEFSDKVGKTDGWIKTMCESCAKKEKRKWRKLKI